MSIAVSCDMVPSHICERRCSMTNYERLFGTPELVAETLISATKSCCLGRCDECPFFVDGCIRTSQTEIAAYLREEVEDE